MNKSLIAILMSALVAAPAFAQTPTPATAPSTMHLMCKDGTTVEATTTRGECRGHGGIDKKAMAKMSSDTPAKDAPMADKSAKPMPMQIGDKATKAMPMEKPSKAAPSPMEQAAGGGDGKVWMNDSTKVYHCQGDRFYGKTKHGEYVTEAEAKTKGAHASHGKACSK